VAARARFNHEERARIEKELAARQLEYVPSQANFVYLRAGSGAVSELLTRGVIVRAMEEDWIRVTVGTVEENDRFLTALDQLGSP
jgi:histidinol-phosphate aminotransferase